MTDFETWWSNPESVGKTVTPEEIFLAGQASAEQRVKELEGDCAILRHAYADQLKAQAGEPFGYVCDDFVDGATTLYEVKQTSHFGKVYRNTPVFTHPTTERRVIPDAIDPSFAPIGYTPSEWYFYADGWNDCLNALNAAPAPTKGGAGE